MSKNQLSLIFGLTAFGREGVTPHRSNLKNGRCLLTNFLIPYRDFIPPQNQSMGLTGFEPVTLRLSSACSNQLSYRPGSLK